MYKILFRYCILIILCSISSIYAANIEVFYTNNNCEAIVSGKKYKCSIGKNGVRAHKIEGDGVTPSGVFPLRVVFFRNDKLLESDLKTQLPLRPISFDDGWCDDPNHLQYNRLVDLKNFDLNISHEKLYRNDNLYDVIIVVGYNDQNVVPGIGSAIFIHRAKENYAPTEGCIGFTLEDLIEIIERLDNNSFIIIK